MIFLVKLIFSYLALSVPAILAAAFFGYDKIALILTSVAALVFTGFIAAVVLVAVWR